MLSHREWMSEHYNDIKNKRITEVYIPGSNKCGSYSLDKKYGYESIDIKLYDKIKNIPCIGMRPYIEWMKTQTYNITKQARKGVRYFDITCGVCPIDNKIRIENNFYGTTVTDILNQLNTYLNKYEKEIFILYFSSFKNFTKETHKHLINDIIRTLQSKIVRKLNKNKTIQELISLNSRAFIIYDNNCCLENQYLISKGFLWNQNPNKTQLASLKKQLKLFMSHVNKQNKEQLSCLQFFIKPTPNIVYDSLKGKILCCSYYKNLCDYSIDINDELFNILLMHADKKFNILSLNNVKYGNLLITHIINKNIHLDSRFIHLEIE